jgi:hypothetical protein
MYNNQIMNSTNKMKTTWNIIKSETGRPNGHTTSEYQNCPDAFNKYFFLRLKQLLMTSGAVTQKTTVIIKSPKYYLSKLSQILFPT